VQVLRHGRDQPRRRGWHDEPVVLRSVAFVIVRRVLDLVGLGPTPDEKDVEIACCAINWRCRADKSPGRDTRPATASS